MASTLGRETSSKDRAGHKDGQVHRDQEHPYKHAKYRHAQRLHQTTQTIDGIIDRRFVVVSYCPSISSSEPDSSIIPFMCNSTWGVEPVVRIDNAKEVPLVKSHCDRWVWRRLGFCFVGQPAIVQHGFCVTAWLSGARKH